MIRKARSSLVSQNIRTEMIEFRVAHPSLSVIVKKSIEKYATRSLSGEVIVSSSAIHPIPLEPLSSPSWKENRYQRRM